MPVTSSAQAGSPLNPARARKLLDVILAVGVIDALLLVVLLYVAFVDHSDSAVSVLGPIHGTGYLILLALTAYGAFRRFWGGWFPLAVLLTGGPLGSLLGELRVRRRLRANVG
ncbi:MAG: DUF3817 domain-containing protein [Solirubrobacteraceae bacterium]